MCCGRHLDDLEQAIGEELRPLCENAECVRRLVSHPWLVEQANATATENSAITCSKWYKTLSVRKTIRYFRQRNIFILMAVWLLGFGTVSIPAAERLTLNFNPDWKFIKADPAGAQSPDFDDHGWATISAPHTYNDMDSFARSSPGNIAVKPIYGPGALGIARRLPCRNRSRAKRFMSSSKPCARSREVYLNGQYCSARARPASFRLASTSRRISNLASRTCWRSCATIAS